ncbi:MAG: pyruvate synthase, partial [Deltaproteobacteria bacterium]|nr:pyruvate synthase [Deltaproteobacteria bacterium]
AREVIELEALIDPLKRRFGRIADKNINALKRAFRETEVN